MYCPFSNKAAMVRLMPPLLQRCRGSTRIKELMDDSPNCCLLVINHTKVRGKKWVRENIFRCGPCIVEPYHGWTWTKLQLACLEHGFG